MEEDERVQYYLQLVGRLLIAQALLLLLDLRQTGLLDGGVDVGAKDKGDQVEEGDPHVGGQELLGNGHGQR